MSASFWPECGSAEFWSRAKWTKSMPSRLFSSNSRQPQAHFTIYTPYLQTITWWWFTMFFNLCARLSIVCARLIQKWVFCLISHKLSVLRDSGPLSPYDCLQDRTIVLLMLHTFSLLESHCELQRQWDPIRHSRSYHSLKIDGNLLMYSQSMPLSLASLSVEFTINNSIFWSLKGKWHKKTSWYMSKSASRDQNLTKSS